jgi:Pectate lyase superfamily protein
MCIQRFCPVAVVLLAVTCVFPVYADSYYPLRPDDPRAVYLTTDQFDVRADGVGDDAGVLQQAINRVQETTRIGVVFIPEGRYRLGKTIYVWQGIRLIGYGRKRPVFVLGKNTPGFQEGPQKTRPTLGFKTQPLRGIFGWSVQFY